MTLDFRLAPQGHPSPRLHATIATLLGLAASSALLAGDLTDAVMAAASMVWFHMLGGAEAELALLRASRRVNVTFEIPESARIYMVANPPSVPMPPFSTHTKASLN